MMRYWRHRLSVFRIVILSFKTKSFVSLLLCRLLFLLLGGGCGLPSAQAQRLTEFLALNTTGIKDPDLTVQPWIEIWNENQTTVLTLTNYKLSSTPPSPGQATIWKFPNIQLMPDERIIIFASGKNRTFITAPLQTSFTLPAAAGSTLSLLNPSDVLISSFTHYPAQIPNVSWGRDDADIAVTPTRVGSYGTPTPGQKNSTYSDSSSAGGVIFSQSSRAFNTTNADATVQLTLTQASPDPLAEIRYNTTLTNPITPRQQHTATALANGRLLLIGGFGTTNLSACELFEPSVTSWLPVDNLTTARRLHSATLLPNGKVLVVGGFGTTTLASAELYDPATQLWANTSSLTTARQEHTATLLNSGKVLIVGGGGATALATCELYDPTTNTWSATGSLATARLRHTANILGNGKVIVAGGLGATPLNSAEIYDPATGLWTAVAPLRIARQQHTASALSNGKLLVVGGFDLTALSAVELYDPTLNTWSIGPPLTSGRRFHTATVLPSGKVLINGGTASLDIPFNSVFSTSQIFDPTLNIWSDTRPMAGARALHTTNLLGNGRVLSVGGSAFSTVLPTAEIYNYLTNVNWILSSRGQVDVPDPDSPLYTGPLTISTTAMIRARVFRPSGLPGATGTEAFLKLEPNARGFSSTMPIAVISSFSNLPPNDGDLPSFLWVWEPTLPDNRARFTSAPILATRIVIDKRGSSTLNNPKLNLNVEARQPYDEEAKDVSLLGMPSHSDWVFHAPFFFDRSLLHNPLAYAMSNAINRYAVRARMAEVFMEVSGAGLDFSGTNSGDYFGVYNILEKIRRGKNRVDITKLQVYDNDAIGKTGGYIFKADRVDAGSFTVGGTSPGNRKFSYYYPKEQDLKSPQRDPQEQFLTAFLTELNTKLQSPHWKDPALGYASHLDVPAALDHHLLNVWTFNVDALRLSSYWTKDRGGKVYPGPLWDFDRALSSTDGRDVDPNIWRSRVYDLGTDFFKETWWDRLFLDPEFYQKYIDRWQELRGGLLSQSKIERLIDSLNDELSAEGISRDLARWGQAKRPWIRPFAAPNNNIIEASQTAEVQRIKDYLQQRANFMDTQWVPRVTASIPAGFITRGTQITLTGPVGVPIFYTLDGTDPRPTGGGAPSASTLIYTSPIPIANNTRLRARAYLASFTALTGPNNPSLISKWGGPVDSAYTTAEIILSEINYHPSNPSNSELAINATWTDNDFEFLEIRNLGNAPIDLNGATLTRGVTFSFSGPNARSIAAGESLVIAANPAAFVARYRNTVAPSGPWVGTLSNSGENLTLLSGGGATLFSVDYLDSWFPETDGSGFTLVAAQYYPADFTSYAAWQRSATFGGSPGAWDLASLPVTAGRDLTLSLGTAPTLSGAFPGVVPLAVFTASWFQVSGPGVLTFSAVGSPNASVSASLPGTYLIRLGLTYNAVTTNDEATLRFIDTPVTWLARHPGIGSLSDDFDSDGRNNFLEFALFTDPALADGSDSPSSAFLSNKLTLTWKRHHPASGLTYQVELSDNLTNFRLSNPSELSDFILLDDGLSQTVRTSDTANLGTPPRRFLRMRVTSP